MGSTIGMDVAERDRAFAVVELDHRVAHRRDHAALQQVLRLREIEARGIDAVVGRRVMLLQLAQQHLQEVLRVVVVAERGQLLHVAARHVLHQQRVGDTVERNGRDHDHLAVSWRHRERDVHGVGLPHAGVKPDAQPPLRLRIGRVLRPVSEELPSGPLPVETTRRSKRATSGRMSRSSMRRYSILPPRLHEVLHQGRKIDPIVDGAARLREVAAKAQRLRKIEDVVVVVIMILRIGPVIDAEIVLARDRHMVMRDGVEQPDSGNLGRPVGDDSGVHAMLLQVEREMQSGDPAPTIPMLRANFVSSPVIACFEGA